MKQFVHKPITLLVVLSFLFSNAVAQKIASLEVTLPRAVTGLDIPVSCDLDEITYDSDTLLTLYELTGSSRREVPFQIESGIIRKIHWFITGPVKAGDKRIFELVYGKPVPEQEVLTSVADGALIIKDKGKNLLQYYFRTVYPPKGVDTSYRRSGFIHPLWAPRGQVLTRIQPPDHYHHYGIWNPWTHVAFEGDTIDFWNINTKQGTVRFANFVSIDQGPVYAGFDALHEHVVFSRGGSTKVAMNELQGVRVYRLQQDQENYLVDFYIQLNSAGESPVKLLEYRYAGLGWRTTEKWDRNNSMVLTSEGKTRKDADGSKARWCIVQGQIDSDYAGVVMMSFPTNYNFPEPLRIWPENQYDRGDMFANFCPTKDMDWLISPRRDYFLKYRFLVFNGPVDAEKAESAWFYFAWPPKVNVRAEK